jgi:protein subunit release factor A
LISLLLLNQRLYDYEKIKQRQQRSELRSAAQGTGDRSDKIRTYNFPQVSLQIVLLLSALFEHK